MNADVEAKSTGGSVWFMATTGPVSLSRFTKTQSSGVTKRRALVRRGGERNLTASGQQEVRTDIDPLEKLTDPQRDVLRLVWRGYDSKEIGRQLGVSHYAINRRIERAVQILGARHRREAARLLAEHEGATCERIACEPLHLPESPEFAMVERPDKATDGSFPWPFATSGRSDGLGVRERLFWALLGIPIVVMLAWGVFLSGVGALDALGR